jgi:hypothetical protein
MMRRLSLRWFIFGLALSFIATNWQGTPTARAADGSIEPVPYPVLDVPGMWHDSNAALTEFVSASPVIDHIHITDMAYLRVGWVVKVDSEQMHITDLIEGGPGNPDTMVVDRAWGGTPYREHTSTTVIEAHTVTVDVWAQNVSDPS